MLNLPNFKFAAVTEKENRLIFLNNKRSGSLDSLDWVYIGIYISNEYMLSYISNLSIYYIHKSRLIINYNAKHKI